MPEVPPPSSSSAPFFFLFHTLFFTVLFKTLCKFFFIYISVLSNHLCLICVSFSKEDSSNAKSPNTETPPQTKPAIPNSFSFVTNGGTFKRRRHLQPPAVVFYRECLKNHATGISGLALDGCGEFMPSPSATHSDPSSLKCADCSCHRNFHRRELEDPSAAHFINFRHPQVLPPPNRSLTPSPSGSRSQSPVPCRSAPHMLLALSTGHSDDYNHHQKALNRGKIKNPSGKKRFMTKFSHTQKEKMQAFVEKLGWKMHKSDDSLVEEFCNEVGVSRGVLKVWIHNNKQNNRKRDHHHHQIGNNISNINNSNAHNHDQEIGNGNGSRVSFDTDAYNNNTTNETHQNECNSIAHLHVSTNGSSSSS